MATPIPLLRLCRWAVVSRAGFYHWRREPEKVDRDMELRDPIQRIALRPQRAAELQDWPVNQLTFQLRRGRRRMGATGLWAPQPAM